MDPCLGDLGSRYVGTWVRADASVPELRLCTRGRRWKLGTGTNLVLQVSRLYGTRIIPGTSVFQY